MRHPLAFTFSFVILAVLAVGYAFGGAFHATAVVWLFLVTPVLDVVFGIDVQNPSVDDEKTLPSSRKKAYDAVLRLWLPLELGFLAWALWLLQTPRPTWEWTLMAVSTGFAFAAGGITVAHELMHRSKPSDKALAEGLMLLTLYPHFCVEHVLGHHRTVATPEDPAQSRRGEWLFAYWPKTVLGGLRSAWHLEGKRCDKVGISTWSLRNRRLRYPLEMAALLGGVFVAAGPVGVGFLLLSSLSAVLLLETINYVEHYGLERRRLDDGRFEPVRPRHSWNAPQRLSSTYLFNLPRHADHHYRASRPYYVLRHFDDAPQMPAGYGTMVVLACCPPLWFAVMNKRVDAWNAQTAPDDRIPVDDELPQAA